MSSRGLRSGIKRKSDESEAVNATSSSPSSQQSKRPKMNGRVSKPQKRQNASFPQDAPSSSVGGTQHADEAEASKANNQKDDIAAAHRPDWNAASESTLILSESIGDIFSAPKDALIIHACNCEGSWGAGIAAAFKSHYPSAFEIYTNHCHMNGGELWHRALLIPPQPDDEGGHFIGCLFTSRAKGRKKDTPAQILKASKPAMLDLMKQVRDYESNGNGKVGQVRMCKINSGLFKVPWLKTKALLESIEVDGAEFSEIKVISREE